MKKAYLLLFVAGLAALIVGYIEMRLPMPVGAQGRDAVFGRLAVTGGARISDDLSIGNALTFGTALTPAMTAKLAATGTASAATFLRGDGAWVGVSPPTYWDLDITALTTSSTSTWTDTGLELAVTASAGDTVILNINMGSVSNCYVSVVGGSIGSVGGTMASGLTRGIFIRTAGNQEASITFVDVPGAGTHTYKVQVRGFSQVNSCLVNSVTKGQWDGSTLFIQVLQ